MSLHRNSQKRYYQENSIYFIVTKTFENFSYFKEPIFCDLFIEDLKICKELKEFKLYGFCLIYDHLNLLIHPNKEFDISEIMRSLKTNFSRDCNYIIDGVENPEGPEGEVAPPRLQDFQPPRLHPQKSFHLQFHMQKYLQNLKNQFIQKYGKNQIIIPKFKWQKSYHDHIIRNEKDFQNHYNYTVYNFQKHNLPNDWKYTSLNYEELVDGIVL